MKAEDQVFGESLLRAAVIVSVERSMAELEAEAQSADIHFSAEHEKRMRHIFAKERFRVRLTKIWAVTSKVAIVLAFLIAVLSVALMLNPSVRTLATTTIIEWFSDHTSFKSLPNANLTEHVEWEFGTLPEGFIEQIATYSEDRTHVLYFNSKGEMLRLNISPNGTGSKAVDNEHSEYHIIFNNDIEYHVFSALTDDDFSNILWTNDGYDFFVTSELEIIQLLDIVFSVRKK
jgi:hypothetical protein